MEKELGRNLLSRAGLFAFVVLLAANTASIAGDKTELPAWKKASPGTAAFLGDDGGGVNTQIVCDEAAFRENKIDDTVLPSLTAEDLKDLDVGLATRLVNFRTGPPPRGRQQQPRPSQELRLPLIV